MHLSSDEYMEGIKLYWGSKDCKMYQGEEASTNDQAVKRSNEPIGKNKIPNEIKILW